MILISDAHIKSRLWTNFSGIQGDAYEALKKVGYIAAQDTVISCGDLFDSNRPSSMDLKAVSDFLKEIEVLLYVNGNHDDAVPDIVSSLGDNVYHLNTQSPFGVGSLAVFGIDWTHDKESLIESLMEVSESIKALPKKCPIPILIMHQSLDVFFMSNIITLKEVRDILGAPCHIFVGDIHDRKKLEGTEGITMSPGPLVPQDLSQATKEMFVTSLKLKDNKLTVTDIPVKVRNYLITDTTLEGIEDIPQYMPLKPVVIIKAPSDWKVPKDLYSREDLIVVTSNIDEKPDDEILEMEASGTLEEAIEAEIEASADEESQKFLKPLSKRLLHAEEPDEILEKLIEKWQVVKC